MKTTEVLLTQSYLQHIFGIEKLYIYIYIYIYIHIYIHIYIDRYVQYIYQGIFGRGILILDTFNLGAQMKVKYWIFWSVKVNMDISSKYFSFSIPKKCTTLILKVRHFHFHSISKKQKTRTWMQRFKTVYLKNLVEINFTLPETFT